MKLKVERYSIQIIPENETDKAYIEEVLGLRSKRDEIPLRRVSVIGIDTALTYIEAKKDL